MEENNIILDDESTKKVFDFQFTGEQIAIIAQAINEIPTKYGRGLLDVIELELKKQLKK